MTPGGAEKPEGKLERGRKADGSPALEMGPAEQRSRAVNRGRKKAAKAPLVRHAQRWMPPFAGHGRWTRGGRFQEWPCCEEARQDLAADWTERRVGPINSRGRDSQDDIPEVGPGASANR